MNEVIIIGAGASGLAAAIGAARAGAKVRILEASDKPAKKILATGNGHCNYTNMDIDEGAYYGEAGSALSSFINNFFYNFDTSDILNFFESIGVYPLIREGYVYPRSGEAATVRNALIAECEKLGIKINTNIKIKDIIETPDAFDVETEGYTYHADKVIIASGLKAGEKPSPSDDELSHSDMILQIVSGFGHKINKPLPALTSFVFRDAINSASGVRLRSSVTVTIDDKAYTEIGEIQINNFGASGIPIMNLSRYASAALAQGKEVKATFNFLYGVDYSGFLEGTKPYLLDLPAKLSKIFEADGITPLNYTVKLDAVRGYESAQVCRGGVDIDEIDPATMQSKLINGLYFAGEVIDIDGKCGGYNLSFAWGSGLIAGAHAAGSKYKHYIPNLEQLRRWEAAEVGSRRG